MVESDVPFQSGDVAFQDEDVTWEAGEETSLSAQVYAGIPSGSLRFAIEQANPSSVPLVVATLSTESGVRVFSSVGLTETEIWSEQAAQADGTYQADGTLLAGAQYLPVIVRKPIVASYGIMRDSGSILPTVALRTKRGREVGNVELTLRNDDDYCGRMIADDAILGGTLTFTIGFRGLRRDEFLMRFQGAVQEILLTKEACILRAEAA